MINVSVEIDPTLEGPDPKKSKKILRFVLETESVVDSKINLIFGDDKLLSSLKIEFFNYGHLTDVIAFRINDYSKVEVEGEIYISLARAIENAKKYGGFPFGKALLAGATPTITKVYSYSIDAIDSSHLDYKFMSDMDKI